ncbi:hypothetical protein FG064_16500 [Vibrio cholerae]|uniref:hypothetical protein n=1 Tax=Vibrio cholerae TaxID=666 RepID=UPI0011D5AA5C|nr:hypothetical protein [Vibrio cholerae]EGR0468598.1 hypothetical protein [Vibrio cholerae]TXY52022.1 hypothetical protein FXE74_18705 [Vibrio cholerae]GIB34666.1 hypothetical protein VCSRO91_3567 [Vibrio cholerae]
MEPYDYKKELIEFNSEQNKLVFFVEHKTGFQISHDVAHRLEVKRSNHNNYKIGCLKLNFYRGQKTEQEVVWFNLLTELSNLEDAKLYCQKFFSDFFNAERDYILDAHSFMTN